MKKITFDNVVDNASIAHKAKWLYNDGEAYCSNCGNEAPREYCEPPFGTKFCCECGCFMINHD